jgi:hypothetical protein
VFDYEDAGGVRENHWLDGEYMGSETFLVCHNCGGDFEDAADCCECGEAFTESELYEGWCEKCLRETINYDTFFEYCMANDGENYLEIFVLSEFVGGMDCPKFISYDFHRLMIQIYKERVQDMVSYESLFGKKAPDDFLPSCIRFIMDDDGSIGRENYADWLNKKGEKK